MTHPFVIIGGDAAGMSAASKIKRERPDAEVVVFERSRHISYSSCGIPYWIGGVVDSARDLVVLTPEIARRRRGIDVRIHHEVVSIDPHAQVVQVYRHDTGEEFSQPYAKLLIATGASPIRPPIPGIDADGVFTLRTLSDGERIFRFMAERSPRSALIIGGGYIGAEMAEALRERNLRVTIVELAPHIIPTLDADMVDELTLHLQENEVTLYTGIAATAIMRVDDALHVTIEGMMEAVRADMVLVATGVRPNSSLAKDASLRLGETGAIWVDAHMRTSDEHIYAAGDCVEHYHLVLGKNAWIPLATSANKGGRIAGENMVGGNARFPGILGTSIVKVFDYTVATTGLTATQAKQSDLWGYGEFVGVTTITNNDKAGYWPGTEEMKVRLVFDRRGGRILGGQLVGKAGVNKRIDIIATAIAAGMTVSDLAMLDLSYAPPYSPTYDPVQICAGVAEKELLPA